VDTINHDEVAEFIGTDATDTLEELMMSLPDELSLLSLFECEPELLDENIPFIYNEATYEFSNSAEERFVLSISPSNSDIKIEVYSADRNELISFLDFKNVEGIEILLDKKEESQILIKNELGSVRINFKPRFKIFLDYTNKG